LKRTNKSNGFTLVEVLVVLAILALLAAVLVPAVLSQIRKGDISRITSDLDATRVGIEAFVADVRRYPDSISHLTRAITGSDPDINNEVYPGGLFPKWDGPYMGKVMTSSGLPTGFGGTLVSDLQEIGYGNGNDYVVIDVDGIAEADFDEIDKVVDGSANSSTGQLRFVTPDTLRFFAVPVN
jgi:prepilin-type N-terminal cleavage/methylation domain-containing protein